MTLLVYALISKSQKKASLREQRSGREIGATFGVVWLSASSSPFLARFQFRFCLKTGSTQEKSCF